MLSPGVLPAAVTPFDGKGRVDVAALARLLAWFESAGCQGVVLAGTNGEGPSLSAVEKRDLLQAAQPLSGQLQLVLGIATPSLEEAVWLCKQAERYGAQAALVMPPYYFRDAPEEGVAQWFEAVLERSPVPVLAYNFPQRTGIVLTAELMARLARHERFAGAKDSSGDAANLSAYRGAVDSGHQLFVGNETLLIDALEAGWTGTISGASNVLPEWLSTVVAEWGAGARESAETKFQLLLPVLESVRQGPQPALNKALLVRLGVLPSASIRLPLMPAPEERVDAAWGIGASAFGMSPSE